jgi:hypothetical protein
MYKEQSLKWIKFPLTFKGGIWLLEAIAWLIGIVDRAIAAFADGQLSLQDGFQLGTVIVFFLGWFYLKPKSKVGSRFLARTNYVQTLSELKNS